MSKTKMLG